MKIVVPILYNLWRRSARKSLRNKIFPLIVILWAVFCGIPTGALANGGQKVLVLHSYHQGYLWTDMIQEGFSRTMSAQLPSAEIYVEYMNTKRQTAAAMSAHLVGLYSQLYKNVKFDVIVASDNNALDFLLQHRDNLFPGVPVVFCGINDFSKYHFDPDSGYTGVREDLDIVSTIEIALKLHPGTKKVALITDATETGLLNLGLVRKIADQFPGIQWIELHNLTASQLSSSLKQLESDTVILALAFFRDQEGRTFSARQSMEFILSASQRPVYTVWDFYMAPGVVGGKLLSGRLQGENAAALAIKILQGEKAGSLPVIGSPTAYMFDYAGLSAFNLKASQLPDGSLVTGQPDTFFTRYGHYLWSGLALFMVQVLVISLMAWNIARRKREEAAREKAEEALGESESRYRGMIENIQDVFYRADSHGTLLFINPSGARLLGYAASEEITGRSMDSFWRYPEKRLEMLEQLERDGVIRDYDVLLVRKDGAPIPVSTSLSRYYDRDGQVLGVEGIFRDITERKQAEAAYKQLQVQLQQAQKMEAIGTLAGGIAHDFNNILAAILGYAEMARYESPPGSVLARYIDQVIKAAERAIELVKQILAFSRQSKTEHRPIQLATLVKDAIKMMRSSLPATITIKQEIDPDLGFFIGDPTEVHQILMNLCTNAFHAMEATGGTLTIALRKKECTPQELLCHPDIQPGLFVQLAVGDTGAGIDPEIRKRIFDPYFTTKEIGKGTGMGLAIVHGIVKSYGGSISCTSQLGAGTLFEVLLPVIAEATLATDQPLESVALGNERVLFIDDEEMLAEMGKDTLEVMGYKVTTLTSSLEALAVFENQPDGFDVVITDQTMPGLTGIDLAKRMLQIRADLPIILCTGYSSLVDETRAKEEGIQGFAMKPLTKKGLAALLKQVLAEKRPV